MFGLYEDRHHARFASDLLVENNPRLNVFALLRSGALTDGVVTRLKWGEKACQLTPQRTGILLDDGEQQQRIAIVWHSPLPWIGKPAFVCPACNRDCYCLHEKAGVFACRKCHGMSYASRHLYRSLPGVHRVSRLRRKIGADPRPFTPLPKRPKHHARFHRVVAQILFEERALLGHLQTLTRDLDRRIRSRKAKHQW